MFLILQKRENSAYSGGWSGAFSHLNWGNFSEKFNPPPTNKFANILLASYQD